MWIRTSSKVVKYGAAALVVIGLSGVSASRPASADPMARATAAYDRGDYARAAKHRGDRVGGFSRMSHAQRYRLQLLDRHRARADLRCRFDNLDHVTVAEPLDNGALRRRRMGPYAPDDDEP